MFCLLASPFVFLQGTPRWPVPHRTEAQRAFETARVIEFDEAARTGLDPKTVLPPEPGTREVPQPDAFLNRSERAGLNPTQIIYDYNDSTIGLDVATGRIEYYSENQKRPESVPKYNPDGSLGPRLVSDEQAIALAKRFFVAAGWGECVPRPTPDNRGRFKDAQDGEDGIEVALIPTAGGVPYEANWSGVVAVDRRTGQLNRLMGPPVLLQPPLSFMPRGTAQQARDIALRFGTDLRGEALDEAPGRPLVLCLWAPLGMDPDRPVDPLGRPYGPKAIRAFQGKHALLVYRGLLRGGSREASLVVTVDAETGEVIETEPLPVVSTGGAGGSVGAPKGALDVPATDRSWRVSTSGKGWDAWTAPASAALAPDPAPAPVAGLKLDLTDGRAAFPALYDPATGLLAISGRAYKPGPALAELLKRRAKA